MCGIAGILYFDRGRARDPSSAALVRRMGRQLARRGPDEERVYGDDHLLLLFRRLAVNDVAHGSQPFIEPRTGIVSATNGEIYNHLELRAQLADVQFKTRCDAEVVGALAARDGADFPRSLRGMFSCAVWQPAQGELILARDRFGIKPLYCFRGEDCLVFASELKALLVHPETPAEIAWSSLIGHPGGPGRAAVPPGIEEVPPAHAVIFGVDESVETHRYWDIRTSLAQASDGDADAARRIGGYAELFSQSVKEHLLSDVPLGVFLSGGIDSSLVTAEARRHVDDLHAFTIVHESTVESGDAAVAVRVARETGTRLHLVDFRGPSLPARLGVDLAWFEYFVWVAEKPWFSLEDVFKHELHRVAKSVVPGLKVILLGQGADEFAGGYSNQAGLGVANRGWDDYLSRTVGSLRSHGLRRFLRRDFESSLLHEPWGEYGRQVIFHAERTLGQSNLRTEDRVSSAQGIEARVPFLDHRLVEYLASTPPALREPLFWDKRIVRDALARHLPSYPSDHRKYPFIFGGTLEAPARHLWGILSAVFPQFRDEYLADPGSPLDAASVVGSFEELAQRPSRAYADIEALQECMSLAVWDRWLRRLKSDDDVAAPEIPPNLPRCLDELPADLRSPAP
jgi:asparagine synthase (glutamine-hydrolysing)